MIATMLMAAVGAGTPVAALEPTGKWVVNYGDNGCAMARAYGEGKNQILLIWRALPLEETAELSVTMPGAQAAMYRGVMDIAMSPGTSDSTTFESFGTAKGGKKVVRMTVKTHQFADLPERTVMTLAPSRGRAMGFVLVGAQRAVAALARCNDATLREWKIDPAERDRIAIPAVGKDERGWLSAMDYPAGAVLTGRMGTTAIMWTIGIDGRVPECRVVLSSGATELDAAACAAIKSRGRFTPAVGKDGAPMVSHKSRRVIWMLPGAWQDDLAYRRHTEAERREWEERRKAADAVK